jgi:hypothetical protein
VDLDLIDSDQCSVAEFKGEYQLPIRDFIPQSLLYTRNSSFMVRLVSNNVYSTYILLQKWDSFEWHALCGYTWIYRKEAVKCISFEVYL